MSTQVHTDLDFLNASKIVNLPAATVAGQPVVFEQLNAAVEGISWKSSARVSTQGNVNLAAPGATIDGITMAVNDRFLARLQTAGAENGIYVWNGAAVPAARSVDANTARELEAAVVAVEEGTDAGKSFRQTTVNFVLETGAVAFTQFGASTGAASTTSAGIVRLATTAEANTGTAVDIAVTPADLSAYTGFSKKYATAFGDGAATTFTITHNLNTSDVLVNIVRNAAPFDEVIADVARTTVNTLTVTFTGAVPTANQFRAVVIG